jgi:hypothetical protein
MPKKTAILETVRSAEGLRNGSKSSSVPGHPPQSTAQKGLVSSNPLEGALDRLEERSLLAAVSKQRTEYAPGGNVVDQP